MKKRFTRIALLTTLLLSSLCASEKPVDMTTRTKELQDLRFGMFICWSFSTFCTPSYPSYTELYPPLSWLHACLSALGTPPDFESGSGFKCIHRQVGDTDLYFIANPDPVWREADCTFRVAGKQPELWDPVAGAAQRQALYREKDGLTTLPLRLGPSGSAFVVFPKPVSKTVPVVAVSKDGTNIVSNHSAPSPEWATMELQAGAGNHVDVLAWEPGRYELMAADGTTAVVEVKGVPALQFNRKLDPNAPLAESGLLGPVRIVIGERTEVVFSRQVITKPASTRRLRQKGKE